MKKQQRLGTPVGIFLQNKVNLSENLSRRFLYEASEKRKAYKNEKLSVVQNQIITNKARKEFIEKNLDTIDFFADSDEEENNTQGKRQRKWKRNIKKDNFLHAESQGQDDDGKSREITHKRKSSMRIARQSVFGQTLEQTDGHQAHNLIHQEYQFGNQGHCYS